MLGAEATRVYRIVVNGFQELGITDPKAIRRAVIFRERTFAGQQFQCDRFQAIWLVGEDLVRFYDSHGKLLKSAKLEEQAVKKAA